MTAPYSPEAEQALLGCMLAEPNQVIDDLAITLDRDDFYDPAHQELFAVLCQMRMGKSAIDVLTVHQQLVDRKLADSVGSPGILGQLLNGFTSYLHASSYLQAVKDKSVLRRLHSACTNIVETINDGPESVAGVLDLAERSVLEIGNPERAASILDATTLAANFEEHLRQISAGEKEGAIKTGYECIDRINGGLKPGGMHVFGARPGLGKTSALLNLSQNLCERKVGVGMISLEMDHIELMTSVYAFVANINSRRFKDKLNEQQLGEVKWATNKIRQWPLQVDDCSLLDVNGLRHKARRMVKNGMKVLMIDYLQLMQAPAEGKRSRSRADEVAEMSRTIKLLGKELGVPIVIGAQLNRAAADGAPGAHNLRESGAIEQDADVIILLKIKRDDDGNDAPTVEGRVPVLWGIDKWRGGEAGFDIEFMFDKTRQRFHELPTRRDPMFRN